MIIWRVLGGVGRTLITAGILILLFVAYQLWGTGIQEARAQDGLQNEFLDFLEEAPALDAADADASNAAGTDDIEAAVNVTGSAAAEQTGSAELVDATAPAKPKASIAPERIWKDSGEAVARIIIDAIGVDKVVVAGTGVEPLRLGPGHYTTTAFPGQPGNAAIAGHRTTYGAPFHRIDELQPGDEITVQTIQGVHTYEVDAYQNGNGEEVGYFIVDPSAVEVLGDFGDNRLTLTACHPKYSAAQRIVVTASLVSDPADLVPRPGAIDGEAPQLQADENEQLISDEVAIDDDPSVTLDENGAVVPVADLGGDAGDGSGDSGDAAADTTADPVAAGDEATQESAGDRSVDLPAATGTDAADTGPFSGAEDFGEGLNGDSSAILPSVSWALAAGAVWLAAWFVGTKWRRWPMYAIGIMPFTLLIWMSFVHIDQALPSY